ncbi:MAG: AbrB/MazE/SpoVT family DNA-binding domain-containing protein [Treponema sp.]|nr:AbrB/MazE/SpoVT family DNA-binding domain-containing protein [Treponema sp.]
MKTQELKVARIGNSQGIRIPAETLRRYGIGSGLIMEEREDGILLKPLERDRVLLSWQETAREMAGPDEDWGALDGASNDGIDDLDWVQAAEAKPAYRA